MPKVLVVDDSALMRRQIRRILEEAGFDVVIARHGIEALEMVRLENPDVITLDINMPEMDGLTFLSRLMTETPKPVVMVSSLTEEGALATLEAMELGAVDYVHKPDGTVSLNLEKARADIVAKVRAAASARLRRTRGLRERLRSDRNRIDEKAAAVAARQRPGGSSPAEPMVVLVGVSTGGPSTVEEIITALPADFPCAMVIAQHMPSTFTSIFARRLNDVCLLPVDEVSQPLPLEAGRIYVARGDADVVFIRRGRGVMVTAAPSSPNWFWHPSVDHMVETAMKVLPPSRLLGVLLTGMGNDGARKMAELRAAGGRTIAESEETAVVFGMPQELIRLGGAELTLPSHAVAGQLVEWTMAPRRARRPGG
jgi:two-component system chemotaxis response regulator CheB